MSLVTFAVFTLLQLIASFVRHYWIYAAIVFFIGVMLFCSHIIVYVWGERCAIVDAFLATQRNYPSVHMSSLSGPRAGVENLRPAQLLNVARVITLFKVQHTGRLENVNLS